MHATCTWDIVKTGFMLLCGFTKRISVYSISDTEKSCQSCVKQWNMCTGYVRCNGVSAYFRSVCFTSHKYIPNILPRHWILNCLLTRWYEQGFLTFFKIMYILWNKIITNNYYLKVFWKMLQLLGVRLYN